MRGRPILSCANDLLEFDISMGYAIKLLICCPNLVSGQRAPRKVISLHVELKARG